MVIKVETFAAADISESHSAEAVKQAQSPTEATGQEKLRANKATDMPWYSIFYGSNNELPEAREESREWEENEEQLEEREDSSDWSEFQQMLSAEDSDDNTSTFATDFLTKQRRRELSNIDQWMKEHQDGSIDGKCEDLSNVSHQSKDTCKQRSEVPHLIPPLLFLPGQREISALNIFSISYDEEQDEAKEQKGFLPATLKRVITGFDSDSNIFQSNLDDKRELNKNDDLAGIFSFQVEPNKPSEIEVLLKYDGPAKEPDSEQEDERQEETPAEAMLQTTASSDMERFGGAVQQEEQKGKRREEGEANIEEEDEEEEDDLELIVAMSLRDPSVAAQTLLECPTSYAISKNEIQNKEEAVTETSTLLSSSNQVESQEPQESERIVTPKHSANVEDFDSHQLGFPSLMDQISSSDSSEYALVTIVEQHTVNYSLNDDYDDDDGKGNEQPLLPSAIKTATTAILASADGTPKSPQETKIVSDNSEKMDPITPQPEQERNAPLPSERQSSESMEVTEHEKEDKSVVKNSLKKRFGRKMKKMLRRILKE